MFKTLLILSLLMTACAVDTDADDVTSQESAVEFTPSPDEGEDMRPVDTIACIGWCQNILDTHDTYCERSFPTRPEACLAYSYIDFQNCIAVCYRILPW